MELGLFEENNNLRKLIRARLERKGHDVVIDEGNAADAWIAITDRHTNGERLDAALVNFDPGPHSPNEHTAEMIASVLRERYADTIKIGVVMSNGHREQEPPEADFLLVQPDANEFLGKLEGLQNQA